jgi:hypothetical protein
MAFSEDLHEDEDAASGHVEPQAGAKGIWCTNVSSPGWSMRFRTEITNNQDTVWTDYYGKGKSRHQDLGGIGPGSHLIRIRAQVKDGGTAYGGWLTYSSGSTLAVYNCGGSRNQPTLTRLDSTDDGAGVIGERCDGEETPPPSSVGPPGSTEE